jgi:DNA-binding transcriptional MerR regulator
MKIGEVVKQTNLSEDALRFYEKNNLIGTVPRINGIREYSEQNLQRINFVKCLRGAEVPIEIIRQYVELVDKGEDTLPERIKLLENQREVLERKLAEIQAARDKIVYKINLYTKGE